MLLGFPFAAGNDRLRLAFNREVERLRSQGILQRFAEWYFKRNSRKDADCEEGRARLGEYK